jgi:hypothetical protein
MSYGMTFSGSDYAVGVSPQESKLLNYERGRQQYVANKNVSISISDRCAPSYDLLSTGWRDWNDCQGSR